MCIVIMLLTMVQWSEDRIPFISKPLTVSGVGCYWTLVIKGNRNDVMSLFVNFQTLNLTSQLKMSLTCPCDHLARCPAFLVIRASPLHPFHLLSSHDSQNTCFSADFHKHLGENSPLLLGPGPSNIAREYWIAVFLVFGMFSIS